MLKIHTQRYGNIAILCLQGRIVTGQIESLASAVNAQSGVNAMVLDLSRISRIDARGLGAMLELRQQAQANGIAFKLMNVTILVRQLLEITRLDSVFEVVSEQDVKSALKTVLSVEVNKLVPCAQAA
jgi:anti-anti-sigma factor